MGKELENWLKLRELSTPPTADKAVVPTALFSMTK